MLPSPELLRPDNFTPSSRTPWGGRAIVESLKEGVVEPRSGPIGESWEISVEPSFPSRILGRESLLRDVIAADPVAWLGEEIARGYGQTSLLVKLLDAGDDLSLQVHPSWDDPALDPDESGKCESWVILGAAPGCGIYLGFKEGVHEREVGRCIRGQGALDQLMNFVPVRAGDVFNIRDGTPHAVGRGVTLFEPQAVLPGRRTVTYRYWDWNRCYDANGMPDPAGRMRDLHLERSLAVTSWEAPRGAAFVDWCRERPRVDRSTDGLTLEHLMSCPWYDVRRFTGSGALRLSTEGRLTALTAIGGVTHITGATTELKLSGGFSAVVPAQLGEVTLTLESADLFVVGERLAQASLRRSFEP